MKRPALWLAAVLQATDDTALAEWWGHGATDFRFQLFVYDPISSIAEKFSNGRSAHALRPGVSLSRYRSSEANPRCAMVVRLKTQPANGDARSAHE